MLKSIDNPYDVRTVFKNTILRVHSRKPDRKEIKRGNSVSIAFPVKVADARLANRQTSSWEVPRT
jgi:hypothetical protein